MKIIKDQLENFFGLIFGYSFMYMFILLGVMVLNALTNSLIRQTHWLVSFIISCIIVYLINKLISKRFIQLASRTKKKPSQLETRFFKSLFTFLLVSFVTGFGLIDISCW